MLYKLLHKFKAYARWQYVLLGFGLMVFINAVAFPWAGKKLNEIAPNAAGPIDLKFTYSPDEVYQMVESYGEQGRGFYAMYTLGIDVPYPIIYTLTFILLLLILLTKTFPANERIRLLALLPLVTFFADIFENTGIVLMLKNFPERLNGVATITSFFSSLKWTFVGVTLLLLIFLLLKILFSKTKN